MAVALWLHCVAHALWRVQEWMEEPQALDRGLDEAVPRVQWRVPPRNHPGMSCRSAATVHHSRSGCHELQACSAMQQLTT